MISGNFLSFSGISKPSTMLRSLISGSLSPSPLLGRRNLLTPSNLYGFDHFVSISPFPSVIYPGSQHYSISTPQVRYSSSSKDGHSDTKIPMERYPIDRVRNFCIIAHIDHGKTTLSSRLMEETRVLRPSFSNELYLDTLQVEKERGITIKAQTVSMDWNHYLLNLIDTPGHVDFSSEVVRGIKASEGAILLVDALQGMQAQTYHNLFMALEKKPPLKVLPVLNKVDLVLSLGNEGKDRLDFVENEIQQLLGDHLGGLKIPRVSAKLGSGVLSLLDTLVDYLPAPQGSLDKMTRALLFDTWHDDFKGVGCLFKVVDGCLELGEEIRSHFKEGSWIIQELGVIGLREKIFKDDNQALQNPTNQLDIGEGLVRRRVQKIYAGQVGYAFVNCKDMRKLQPGDTFFRLADLKLIHQHKLPCLEPLPGIQPSQPMVYSGIYPANQEDFHEFSVAIDKLLLTDWGVTTQKERSNALGTGFRCGFLGMLHLDVFTQRIEQEFKIDVIKTAPTVPYLGFQSPIVFFFFSNHL